MLRTQDHTDGAKTLIGEEGRITVYEVTEMLDISAPDKDPSGRPTMLCTQDHTDGAKTLIGEEGRITVYEVTEMLDISYASAYATA